MIQSKYPEYHPLMAIANIAHNAKAYLPDGTEVPDQNLELRCHQTIAKYCETELKSVEVRGHIDHNVSTLKVVMDTTKPPLLTQEELDTADVLEPIVFEELKNAGD